MLVLIFVLAVALVPLVTLSIAVPIVNLNTISHLDEVLKEIPVVKAQLLPIRKESRILREDKYLWEQQISQDKQTMTSYRNKIRKYKELQTILSIENLLI